MLPYWKKYRSISTCIDHRFSFFSYFVEPMRTPKRLKIAETRSRLIAVDWESLGYNITRCHTFNVTICYHYMTANDRSKADCLDMDPKGTTYFSSYLKGATDIDAGFEVVVFSSVTLLFIHCDMGKEEQKDLIK